MKENQAKCWNIVSVFPVDPCITNLSILEELWTKCCSNILVPLMVMQQGIGPGWAFGELFFVGFFYVPQGSWMYLQ